MAGGAALAEGATGWGSPNKARIRNVADTAVDPGDGLRVSHGGSINSPLGPIYLEISGCARDGIRLEAGSWACFGKPEALPVPSSRIVTGLVTKSDDAPNRQFGMNVRNASRALIGSDTALRGMVGEVALDGQVTGGSLVHGTPLQWRDFLDRAAREFNGSLVRLNIL